MWEIILDIPTYCEQVCKFILGFVLFLSIDFETRG